MPGIGVDVWRKRLSRFAMGAAGTAVLSALGVLRNKWLAQHLATAGIGTLAQVLSAMNWLGLATSLGLGIPVTRAVASARGRGDLTAERRTVRAALLLTSWSVLVVAAAALLAAPLVSQALLGTPEYAGLVRIALIGTAGLALWMVVQGIFAGHADVRAPIAFAVGGGGLATLLTLLLVPRFGLPGATVAAALLFPCGIAAALWHRRREYAEVLGRKPGGGDGPGLAAGGLAAHGREMLGVGAAMLLLALVDAGSLLALRAHYVRENGLAANGLLQAALALAQQVGSLFYGYLSAYAFGTISAAAAGAKDRAAAAAVRAYSRRHWAPLLALAAVCLAITMTCATPLLRLLYSTRFDPARPLLAWTLLGEFGRICMQVWMLGALPLGGVRLYAPIALSYPVSLVAAYAALHAAGAGERGLPQAYAAAGLASFLVAAGVMGRRGVTLGAREVGAMLLAGGALAALAWWTLHS
jgi:Na+-driven multidrug efflux pump